jgi:ribosomal protein L7/L12
LSREIDYVTQDWIVEQFHHLRFRISFKTKAEHTVANIDVLNDMDWVKRQIEYSEAGVVIRKSKFKHANLLWKRYSDTGITKDNIWELIDHCIDSKRKISAIKEYRKYFKCGLREAKEAIETREANNKGLV